MLHWIVDKADFEYAFLVAKNSLNISCSNTVFNIYLRNLIRCSQIYCTALVLDTPIMSNIAQYQKIYLYFVLSSLINVLLHLVFMEFYTTKNVCLKFFRKKRPKLTNRFFHYRVFDNFNLIGLGFMQLDIGSSSICLQLNYFYIFSK